MSNPLKDMDKPDVIFCIGTNMTECHPVAATRLKQAVAKGAKLIVADPRRIELAVQADLYLPLRVGSDVALLLAMAHVIQREGLVDFTFMQERTANVEPFLKHIKGFSPEWAEGITGIPATDIEQAAIWYGEAERGAIFYTLGITQHICGTDNVQSLSNLALMTGNLGREGTGINPMRGQNNVQGSGDSGALPGAYPGNQAVLDPRNHKKFSDLYGRSLDRKLGPTKISAFQQAGDQIQAMFICGENSLVSDADRSHTEHALKSLEFLVVADIFLTETAELADVVFPASAWAETDGTCTNTERRVQRVRAALSPIGNSKPDWWIIAELAKRLDITGFEYQSAAEIFNELCQVSPIYHGLNWQRVAGGQYQWPVPHSDHPGTPRLHEHGFANGKGILKIIEYQDPAEVISKKYPIWLTTGRRLETYHTHTQTGRSKGIDYLVAEEKLEVHPEDVKQWGLKDGGWCRISSPRGSVKIKVKATTRSNRGTVFSSFSFNEVPINNLTTSKGDAITGTPEVKVCPIRID